MTSRIFQKNVTFVRPFWLCGYNSVLPAGTYRIDIEEQQVESLSFVVFLRKQITLYLPNDPSQPGITEMLNFAASELAAALVRDQRANRAATFKRQKKDRQAVNYRAAIARAENEGMPQPR